MGMLQDQDSPTGPAGGDAAGSLRRAVPLVRAIAQGTPIGASIQDLIARTRLPRPTIYRILDSLIEVGWVERDSTTRRYHLGDEIVALGLSAATRHPIERRTANALAELAAEVRQPIYLMVRSGLDGVCLARHESPASVQALVLKAGDRVPMGRGANTMAMLAAMPEAEADDILRRNADRYRTAEPAIDGAAVHQCLLQARARGFASHDEAFVRGMSGIGVALRDASGYPIAGISTAFVSEWMGEAQRIECSRRLAATAAQLTELLTNVPAAEPADRTSNTKKLGR